MPTPTEIRQSLRAGLASGKLLRFPGAFSPLVASAVADHGFDGVYLSGAAFSSDLALPDIGLTTITEVATRARQITQAVDLPLLVDADTGFGEMVNVARTIGALEDAGVVGCHLEDQVNPKRCGHLDNKELVSTEVATQRIAAAVAARRDPGFVICARTDAAGVEGVDASIERAKAYIDAGADMVFPEGLESEAEFEKVRKALDVPLLANMTEFGKSPLLDTKQLTDLGYNLVIWPVSTLRAAMGAVERLLTTLTETGSATAAIPDMQTRKRLYELNHYADYAAFDNNVANFSTGGHQ